MNNIYFINKRVASWYLNNYCEKIYGNMYRMSDGRLIKEYDKEKIKDRFIDFSEDRLLDFKDIDIEGVSFIKALVYTGFYNIYGTITEDVPGISIDKEPLGRYQIDNLIEAIRKFEITIKKLSNKGISANDIYTGNIVYDGKILTLIDTAEYYYREKDILSLQEDNMSQIMNEIFYNIFTITGYRDIYYLKRYFETISSKYADFNKREFLLNPSEHLIEMRKLIEEDFGIRLNTFNDSHILMIKKVECEKIKRKIL